ncbi:hypothetical protein BKP45_10150 [Anaerobacillus alkalidiazotrophicus]|uniref:Acriflavin resistance protein n=1 Tax=Anaerobacillus alkalidiazotrophicus TaxID=472963 RepID=A0A1S2M5W6_9BACI|nr:efflux RND transporter permease subunit [Anaerobacillus alkalidiazotrophicus]OIJ20139.1 hypothetical protein BKP45_10150 [Anaerobacillus alkalidiazotrophicus]
MNWLKFLVGRKLIIGLFSIFIVLVGAFSINKLDVELMPDITFDMAVVNIYAGEVPAIDVEDLITTPIEQRLSSINEIDSYTSTSAIGYSNITIVFESGAGDKGFQDVEAIVNSMKSELPFIEDSYVFQMGMGSPYEHFLDIYGGEMTEMAAFAEEIVKPRLESLPEVGEVLIFGNVQEEVVLELIQDKLEEHRVDPQQIMYFLNEEDKRISVGEFEHGSDIVTVRWDTQISSIDTIKYLPIPTQTGIIKLKDIANVKIDSPETSSGSWKNGDPNYLSVQIARSGSATAVSLSDAVRAEVDKIYEEGLVNGFQFEELMSGGQFIQNSIDDVKRNVLIGGLLALLVVLLFLRNFRAMLVIGIAIPLSILLTFTTMFFLEYSINMFSLIALGLGIGMMVDAAIVILEAIYRKLQEGKPRLEAVIDGTKEVSTAVIASMLTTVVVFLPIGIMGGEIGDFMMLLAVVIIVTLVSSVLVSFTIIPVLAHAFVKVKASQEKKEAKIIRLYGKLIAWITKKKWRRWVVVFGFFLMFVGSIIVGSQAIKFNLLPDIYQRQAEFILTLEKGVTPEDHKAISNALHEGLKDMDDIKDYIAITMTNDLLYSFVNMTPEETATLSQEKVNENIRELLEELQEEYPIKDTSMLAMFGADASPVQIKVKGQDLELMQEKVEEIIEGLTKMDDLFEIGHSMEHMQAELKLVIDEEKIEDAGLVPSQIRNQLQLATAKQPIGQMFLDGKNLPIMLTTDHDITTTKDLEKIEIQTFEGIKKLSDFVSFETIESPIEIYHDNGERIITVRANYDGGDLGSINREVQAMLNDIDRSGLSITTGGDLSEQDEVFQDLILIFFIALFLVYVVMAVQFNSLSHPFVIMSIIPLTIVGVILGVVITQVEFSVMSGMGVVMLIGIVLNNAILLIDRTKQLRQQEIAIGEALIQAGKNRMRPIFLTTLTTAAGMLPLALATGGSSAFQAPMATVVISGLLFATMITLILIPAVYLIFDDVFGWPKRSKARKRSKMIEINHLEQ